MKLLKANPAEKYLALFSFVIMFLSGVALRVLKEAQLSCYLLTLKEAQLSSYLLTLKEAQLSCCLLTLKEAQLSCYLLPLKEAQLSCCFPAIWGLKLP